MKRLWYGLKRKPIRAWLIWNGRRVCWQLQTWKPRYAIWKTNRTIICER